MKKFLTVHGLGILLSAMVISSLLTIGLWWKIVIIAAIFVFQAVLESFDRYSHLRWNRDHSGFTELEQDGDFIRNVWFSGVKVLATFFIIGYSLYYGEQSMLVNWVVVVAAIVSFFLYYGKNLFSDKKEEKNVKGFDVSYKEIEVIKRYITIFLIYSSLGIAYLNFGTQYVWLASLLAIMSLIGLLVVDLIGEVEFENTKTKKVVIIVLSLLPFLIGIISTVYQFWTNIFSAIDTFWLWLPDASKPGCDAIVEFLTFKVGSVSVWLILLIIFVLGIAVNISRDHLNYLDSKRKTAAEQVKMAKERAETERLKAEHEETRKRNLLKIIYFLAHDKKITKEYLVYLGKNIPFIKEFPIKKITAFNFDQFFSISNQRRKIVWEHDLKCVLEMYDAFFKNNETSDEDLEAIIRAIKRICTFVEPYKHYQYFSAFKKMMEEATPNIMSQWQEL